MRRIKKEASIIVTPLIKRMIDRVDLTTRRENIVFLRDVKNIGPFFYSKPKV